MICPLCRRPTNRIRRGLGTCCYQQLLDTGARIRLVVHGDPWTRFLAHVQFGDQPPPHAPDLGPCWWWTASTDDDGYGQFRLNRDTVTSAFHFAHDVVHGVPAPGLVRDHYCHDPATCPGGRTCPHRPCVSPAHIRAVPWSVNQERSNSPQAINGRKLECIHGHPLAGENLYIHPRRGTRDCRACRARRDAAQARRPGDDQLALPV